jgi:hypothetical protein
MTIIKATYKTKKAALNRFFKFIMLNYLTFSSSCTFIKFKTIMIFLDKLNKNFKSFKEILE